MAVPTETGAGLRATARRVDGLRHEIVIRDRFVLETDEPERLGGGDAAPAPHELLPAALAGCVATSLAMYARQKGWELDGTRVEVDYDHRASPRRCTTVVHLPAELAPEQRERLERVARTCPVRRAIEEGIEFEERLLLDA